MESRERESGISGKVRWNLGKGNLELRTLPNVLPTTEFVILSSQDSEDERWRVEFRERLDGISGKGIWKFGKG
jgi:hypothetical protein